MQFSAQTFAAITGFDLPTTEMKANMQGRLQEQKMAGAQIPPQIEQQVQQLVSTPSMEEVVQFLQNDPMRQYRIDIETNSTVDVEATEDKGQVGEFLNAIAQFLNGITPIVQQGVLPPEAAKSIMTAVVKRFRFGLEVEESLAKMTIPQPQPEGKEAPAQAPQPTEAEMAAQQTQVLAEQLKQQNLQLQAQLDRAEHAYKMEELSMKSQVLKAQAEKARADLAKPKETSNANV
jgi:hypothetical protein